MKITLYRIEDKDLGENVTFSPKIPTSAIMNVEDEVTPRVCACLTPYGCILAAEYYGIMPDKMKVWLYSTTIDTEEYDVYQPTIDQLPDVDITGEFWIQKTVAFKRVTDNCFYIEKQMPIDNGYYYRAAFHSSSDNAIITRKASTPVCADSYINFSFITPDPFGNSGGFNET